MNARVRKMTYYHNLTVYIHTIRIFPGLISVSSFFFSSFNLDGYTYDMSDVVLRFLIRNSIRVYYNIIIVYRILFD